MINNSTDAWKTDINLFLNCRTDCVVLGRVLPYMGYIAMCGPKGYDFLAVLVRNLRILAMLVSNRV